MSGPALHLVADVPAAFAALARDAQDRTAGRLRFATSGGGSGRACMDALVAAGIDWRGIELFQVDERCVPADSPDSNARSLSEALGAHRGELGAFHEMDCAAGAEAYEALLLDAGGLDLVQLGVGPDGHTASLFPGSAGLGAGAGHLVVENHDPSGHNAHPRLTLTFAALASAGLVVVTVFGESKHDVLRRLVAGEDLPAQRLVGANVTWLVDRAAAGGLSTVPLRGDRDNGVLR